MVLHWGRNYTISCRNKQSHRLLTARCSEGLVHAYLVLLGFDHFCDAWRKYAARGGWGYTSLLEHHSSHQNQAHIVAVVAGIVAAAVATAVAVVVASAVAVAVVVAGIVAAAAGGVLCVACEPPEWEGCSWEGPASLVLLLPCKAGPCPRRRLDQMRMCPEKINRTSA